MNDLPSFRSEPGTDRLTLRALVSIGCLFTAVPAFAQADLAGGSCTCALNRRHRHLKHFNQHQTGYLAVKLPLRITTYLKQVSMPVEVPKDRQIEGIVSE